MKTAYCKINTKYFKNYDSTKENNEEITDPKEIRQMNKQSLVFTKSLLKDVFKSMLGKLSDEEFEKNVENAVKKHFETPFDLMNQEDENFENLENFKNLKHFGNPKDSEDDLVANLEALEDLEENIEDTIEKLADVEEELEEIESDLQICKEDLKDLKEEIQEQVEAISQIEKTSEVQGTSTQKLAEIVKLKEKLKEVQERLEQASKRREDLYTQKEELSTSLNELKKVLDQKGREELNKLLYDETETEEEA